ncbi:MAG: tyrosine--tRNA ligase [Patescibacteria group bacterium]|jgi:tyrosyl-tRNA synthetase
MAKITTDKGAITEVLSRAVENVYPSREALESALASGKRLRVYTGVDPTAPTLHLGHVIWMRKLAELQRLGHEVILLIGDFTAMIGDPTDKSATRQQLTRKEVLVNCKKYKDQASRFLSFSGANAAQLKFNSAWLAKMSFTDVIELASHFTVQQMVERDMFEKRIADGKPVHLHEFFYPLMQGYDSVAMEVDIEVGGNDQTFNMLAGRTLLREMKHKEKAVLATKLLVDPTGKKMGKSEGNMITLEDAPEDMYGKVMSWTDGMILPGFELCTNVSEDEMKDMRTAMKNGENPMAFKRRLAEEIVTMLVGGKEGSKAAAHFSQVHSKGERPDEIPEFKVKGAMLILDVLVASKIVSSKSDARRQIEQGGVKVDDAVVTDISMSVKKGSVIQKGKRHFVRLV